MSLDLAPITLRQARAFVLANHRHHKPPQGGLFAIALLRASDLVGVAIAGRPVSRMLDDGRSLEIVRCCVLPGVPNGCSMLYRAVVRAGRALGYRRFITYTLEAEGGASLRGAGFTLITATPGGSWSRASRTRIDQHPTQGKLRWEVE